MYVKLGEIVIVKQCLEILLTPRNLQAMFTFSETVRGGLSGSWCRTARDQAVLLVLTAVEHILLLPHLQVTLPTYVIQR
jgi:hypothetical protein